jgi:hypothetical protein
MAPRPGESLADNTAGIRRAVAVTPSDSTDLAGVTRGLYVGASGNVVVLFSDDKDADTVTLTGLAAGVWHPMQVRRVLSTNTTATGIVAGY